MWMMGHRSMQNAADSAAFSGAASKAIGNALFNEAAGVSATYGYVHGANNVTVIVNRAATSGSYSATPGSVEVIVTKLENRMFSALFGSG